MIQYPTRHVFISSKMDELAQERRVVQQCLRTFNNRYIPWLWEDDAVAQNRSIEKAYLAEVERCEVYLGIFGGKYGKYTIQEFEHATSLNKPRFIFVKNVPSLEREEKLAEFLKTISDVEQGTILPEWFTDGVDLKRRVMRAMRQYLTQDYREWQPPSLPGHDTIFVGRETELSSLEEIFLEHNTVALTAVEGMGGLGKTYLALALAHRLQYDYPGGIFWLDTFGPDARTADLGLRKLAQAHPLGRVAAQEAKLLAPGQVFQWLSEAPGRGLVIGDDIWHEKALQELQQALPPVFNLLITTRKSEKLEKDIRWQVHKLQRLSAADGLKLLMTVLGLPDSTPPEMLAPLAEIVEFLGGHGIGLRLAAGWLRAEGGLKAASRYMELLKSTMNPLDELYLSENRNDSVERAFYLSYQALTAQQQLLFRSLGIFATAGFFSDEAIMAVSGIDLNPPGSRTQVEQDISFLVPALLNRDEVQPTLYYQHSLLHAYAQALLQQNEAERLAIQQRYYAYYLKKLQTGQVEEQNAPQYLKAFTLAEDKPAFFEVLALHLENKPFLWDTLRSAIELFLKDGQFSFIESIGSQGGSLQEVLVSVLVRQFPVYHQSLLPMLGRWIKQRSGEAPVTATKIAVACHLEDLLKRALVHPGEKTRFVVIQAIYTLWKANPVLVENILFALVKQLLLLKGQRNGRFLETLFRATVLLIMEDYTAVGSQTHTVELCRHLWQAAVKRLLLVTGNPLLEKQFQLPRLRRQAINRLAVPEIIKVIRSIEDADDQVIFSYKDVEGFFPVSASNQQALQEIITHLRQEERSISALAALLESLIYQHNNDLVMGGIALAALTSYVFTQPVETAQELQKLHQKMVAFYPKTTSPDQPTGTVWVVITHLPLGNIDYRQLSPQQLEEVLPCLLEIGFNREEHFWNATRYKNREEPDLQNCSVDVIWGYNFNLPHLGAEKLPMYLDLWLQRQHYTQMIRTPRDFVQALMYTDQPEAGLQAIMDVMIYLQKANLPENTQQKLWENFVESLMLCLRNFSPQVRLFLERYKDHPELKIPLGIRERILASIPAEDFNFLLAHTTMKFFRDAFRDENPFLRNLLTWFIQELTESQNMEAFVLESIAYLIELVYGDAIIARKTTATV